jgi:hypothetical protein
MIRPLILLIVVVALMSSARSLLGPGAAAASDAGTALAFGFLVLAAIQSGELAAVASFPRLIGYLLRGLACGPSAAGLPTAPMIAGLKLVSSVAVGLIALSAGCELDLRHLRPRLRSVAAVSGPSMALALALVSGLVPALAGWLPFLRQPWLSSGREWGSRRGSPTSCASSTGRSGNGSGRAPAMVPRWSSHWPNGSSLAQRSRERASRTLPTAPGAASPLRGPAEECGGAAQDSARFAEEPRIERGGGQREDLVEHRIAATHQATAQGVALGLGGHPAEGSLDVPHEREEGALGATLGATLGKTLGAAAAFEFFDERQ